jgi:signal transduction histidine kinase
VGRLRLFTKIASYSLAKSAREPRLKRGSFFWTSVLSGMVVLLTIVAALQYRWTTQVTEATDARIGSNIQSLMMDWHYDFYRELSSICAALQVGPDSGAHDNWQDFLQRYWAWSRNTNRQGFAESINSRINFVENVYIWETSRAKKPRLLRLNPQANKIEGYDVPANMQPLLARLEQRSSSVPVALRAWEFSPSAAKTLAGSERRLSAANSQRSDPITGWQFDSNVPAIVHPIIHQRDVSDQAVNTLARGRVDWIIVALNLQTLRERTLPGLTKRYFETREGAEYDVTIAGGNDPHHVVYSSDPRPQIVDLAGADASMNIFGPTPESGGGRFWQGATGGNSLKGAEWHSLSGPVWFPIVHYATEQDPWVLIVQHRNGPLEAVVKQVRRRNLTISALVLLLLAANMGLVVIAGHRAQKFAKLQMDFVASVSHELRTPLAAIFSAGENIHDGFVEGKSNLKLYGSIITSQARQLTDLVDRILQFASIRSGKDRYVLRRLQVSEILQRARKNTAALIEAEACTFEEHVEPGLPAVLGDIGAVCGCLQNLITNAVKYGGKDRWIRLSASFYDDADDQKQEIRISVQDHGIGISSSELPHIFEPFYRSPQIVAAQIHGTGLGLSVARRLAESMGGRISVVSEVGIGSVFTLHLPAIREQKRELASVTNRGDKNA